MRGISGPGGPARRAPGSGDDIRRELVLDKGDSITQLKFALFQSLDLQEIAAGRVLQGLDGGIQIPVLLHQASQGRPQLPFFLVGHDDRLRQGDKLPPATRQPAGQYHFSGAELQAEPDFPCVFSACCCSAQTKQKSTSTLLYGTFVKFRRNT